MPGNRQIFEQAMKLGNKHVWDKAWTKAIAEYEKALDEFPSDPIALASAGFVYTQLKRMDDALTAYRQANQSQPNDLSILSRLVEVQDRLGLSNETIETCMALAELFSSRRMVEKAVQYWERVVKLNPSHADAHHRLAAAFESLGKNEQAVREYTSLARLYQQLGEVDQAVAATKEALKLSPRQTGLLRMQAEISSGKPVGDAPKPSALPAALSELPPAPPQPKPALAAPSPAMWDLSNLAAEETREEGRGSPLEIARDKALSDLAETLFEDAESLQAQRGARLTKAEIDALIGQALDYQTRGHIDQAIAAYRNILDAVDLPAAHFNLGLLCQQELRFDEAMEQFNQAINHPEYTMGSHFALGECYRALGRVDEALGHFIEVLKIVDLQTVGREQADDLIALYQNLADSYSVKGDREQALSFTNGLVEFLSSRGWEDKVSEARKRLDSITQDGSPAISLAELFTVPNSELVLQSMAMSQEYAKRGKFHLAADEMQGAIERAPDYLPLHMHLAEVLWQGGQSEEAIAKLRTIADTYQVRGDVTHAWHIYQRILDMTPMDVPTRSTLIQLLIRHGQIDPALDQYMQLADTYYQMAQIDKARDTYQEALSYAPRGSTGKLWTLNIFSHLGDIDMQRIDWRRAIQDYEQVKSIAPDDEKARVSLVELYYKVAQPQRAIRELDGLMTLYKESGKMRKMITVMEEQIHLRPGEIPLRSRLARLYMEANMKDQAIEQLDSLGELQLQAGLRKEAAATVKTIITLNPLNIEDYKQLLAQL